LSKPIQLFDYFKKVAENNKLNNIYLKKVYILFFIPVALRVFYFNSFGNTYRQAKNIQIGLLRFRALALYSKNTASDIKNCG